MIERIPNDRDASFETHLRKMKELSIELSESVEVLFFPGLREGAYQRLKDAEALADPNYVTPIDTLLLKFRDEGMVLDGGMEMIDIQNQNPIVSVRPAKTEGGFYGENLLHLKNLNENAHTIDPRLAELIRLAKL